MYPLVQYGLFTVYKIKIQEKHPILVKAAQDSEFTYINIIIKEPKITVFICISNQLRVVNKCIDINIDIKTIGDIRFQPILPGHFLFGNLPHQRANSPVRSIFIYPQKQSIRRVPIMHCSIMFGHRVIFIALFLQGSLGPAHILEPTGILYQVNNPNSGACNEWLYLKGTRIGRRGKAIRSPTHTTIDSTHLTSFALMVSSYIWKKTLVAYRWILNIRSYPIPQRRGSPIKHLRFTM